MSITVKPAVMSPSLNEFDFPTFTDDQGNVLPLLGVVQPSTSGVTGLVSSNVTPSAVSQVTGKRQHPHVLGIPTVGLVGINPTTGAIQAFSAGTASSVSGKFQSAVIVATGSAQNVAHGLGVVPSLVLIAPYDNTASGSTPFTFQIAEGTHTITNVVLTATAGLKFKVIAFV